MSGLQIVHVVRTSNKNGTISGLHATAEGAEAEARGLIEDEDKHWEYGLDLEAPIDELIDAFQEASGWTDDVELSEQVLVP